MSNTKVPRFVLFSKKLFLELGKEAFGRPLLTERYSNKYLCGNAKKVTL